jgi:hypothetical protein
MVTFLPGSCGVDPGSLLIADPGIEYRTGMGVP